MMKQDTLATHTDVGRGPIEKLHRHLDRCVASGFYGKIEVTFQHGRVCDVKIAQTKKLDEL